MKPDYLNPVEVILFEEEGCRYCSYVNLAIIGKIEEEYQYINRNLIKNNQETIPPIRVKKIDVNANCGTKEAKWYSHFSETKLKRVPPPTPCIKIYGKLFYMWGGKTKPDFLSSDQKQKADQVLVDIIKYLQQIGNQTRKKPYMFNERNKQIQYVFNREYLGHTQNRSKTPWRATI